MAFVKTVAGKMTVFVACMALKTEPSPPFLKTINALLPKGFAFWRIAVPGVTKFALFINTDSMEEASPTFKIANALDPAVPTAVLVERMMPGADSILQKSFVVMYPPPTNGVAHLSQVPPVSAGHPKLVSPVETASVDILNVAT